MRSEPVNRSDMVIFGFLLLGMAIGALAGTLRRSELFGAVMMGGFGAMTGGVLAALAGSGAADLAGPGCWVAAAVAAALVVTASASLRDAQR